MNFLADEITVKRSTIPGDPMGRTAVMSVSVRGKWANGEPDEFDITLDPVIIPRIKYEPLDLRFGQETRP